jgi:TorA maturation chaperone TorD
MQSDSDTSLEAMVRAGIYGFIAQVLAARPTEEGIRVLGETAAELGIACPEDLAIGDVDREYLDLFVIPGGRYIAPYESVFCDEWLVPPVLRRGTNPSETGDKIKGLLMGESTLSVRECYLEAGLLPEADLPDHIGNELRFLAWLSAEQARARPEEARKVAEVRDNFRREHVLKWIGELRERVEARERLGYYGVALRVAEAVLQDDEGRSEAQFCDELAPAGAV